MSVCLYVVCMLSPRHDFLGTSFGLLWNFLGTSLGLLWGLFGDVLETSLGTLGDFDKKVFLLYIVVSFGIAATIRTH